MITDQLQQFLMLSVELDDLMAKYPDETEYLKSEFDHDILTVDELKSLIHKIQDQIDFNYSFTSLNEEIGPELDNQIEAIYGSVDYSWNKNRGLLIVDSRDSGEHEFENCFSLEEFWAALKKEIAAYQSTHPDLPDQDENAEKSD